MMTAVAMVLCATGGFVLGYSWCWLQYAPIDEEMENDPWV